MSASIPSKIYPTLIFHVDVNSAFLSWSALKELELHPDSVDLRTIPSAVAGDVETRHGIITAKSIPAKKYGIKTAEPVASALRKCPDLVLVKSDFATYRMYSRELMTILRSFSPVVEQVSIDEAYLDMTHLWSGSQPPGDPSLPLITAEKIRRKVFSVLGFTVNVGISTNRLLAKTASDFTKPDQTHTLWPEEVPGKLWPLPIGELHGCGQATAARLNNIGILTVGDAAHTDEAVLKSLLGNKSSAYIINSARGIGSVHVDATKDEAKSYSNETTTPEDIGPENFEERAVPVLLRLSEKVASRLARDHVYGQTVTVTVKTDRFRRRSHQMTLASSTNDASVISENAVNLARTLLFEEGGPFPRGEKIRLIGVGMSRLDDGKYRQLSLFDQGLFPAREEVKISPPKEKPDPRKEKLDAMMGIIKKRYGEEAIRRGE